MTRLAAITKGILVDGVALSSLLLSLFAFVALTLEDMIDGELPYHLYLTYAYTIGRIIPVIGSGTGVDASIYLTLFLLSFAILRRKRSIVVDALETISLGALAALIFESILYLEGPEWREVVVIAAQVGTGLQWFTNYDLLLCSGVCLLVAQGVLFRLKKKISSQTP